MTSREKRFLDGAHQLLLRIALDASREEPLGAMAWLETLQEGPVGEREVKATRRSLALMAHAGAVFEREVQSFAARVTLGGGYVDAVKDPDARRSLREQTADLGRMRLRLANVASAARVLFETCPEFAETAADGLKALKAHLASSDETVRASPGCFLDVLYLEEDGLEVAEEWGQPVRAEFDRLHSIGKDFPVDRWLAAAREVHPSPQQLAAFLLAEIPAYEMEKTALHLSRCESCSALVSSSQSTAEALGAQIAIKERSPEFIRDALSILSAELQQPYGDTEDFAQPLRMSRFRVPEMMLLAAAADAPLPTKEDLRSLPADHVMFEDGHIRIGMASLPGAPQILVVSLQDPDDTIEGVTCVTSEGEDLVAGEPWSTQDEWTCVVDLTPLGRVGRSGVVRVKLKHATVLVGLQAPRE